MSMKALKILGGLATSLDKKGHTKVADHIEQMIEKNEPG